MYPKCAPLANPGVLLGGSCRRQENAMIPATPAYVCFEDELVRVFDFVRNALICPSSGGDGDDATIFVPMICYNALSTLMFGRCVCCFRVRRCVFVFRLLDPPSPRFSHCRRVASPVPSSPRYSPCCRVASPTPYRSQHRLLSAPQFSQPVSHFVHRCI